MSDRDILVKLYRGAERFLIQAMIGLDNDHLEEARAYCHKAARIFAELLATLETEQSNETVDHLRELYLFLIQNITHARVEADSHLIAELLPIIATLRGAWERGDASIGRRPAITSA